MFLILKMYYAFSFLRSGPVNTIWINIIQIHFNKYNETFLNEIKINIGFMDFHVNYYKKLYVYEDLYEDIEGKFDINIYNYKYKYVYSIIIKNNKPINVYYKVYNMKNKVICPIKYAYKEDLKNFDILFLDFFNDKNYINAYKYNYDYNYDDIYCYSLC